jgi:enterochelin esterase family protein
MMEIPEGAGSLSFRGTSRAFSTLAEFDHLLKSAVATGEVDSFWEAVTATGQMPLIFGDDIAVFLYRGRAESLECRGDFTAQYLRQSGTDLWAFMRQFEPDARVEYKIRRNSRAPVPDRLNPLTETGGLGTSSVVRMPAYRIPEFALPRSDIAHGDFGENITLSSRSLGYNVHYRVYAPPGYATMAHLPVIYVTDGQDYAAPGMGALVNALDSLIADGRIRPLIAVFIDPRDPVTCSNRRERELVPIGATVCPFCDFVALELVPAIDAAYKTDPSPDARVLLGFSLGGMFTAHMGLAYPDLFHRHAIQSPYIFQPWILGTYRKADRLPLKIFLSHGSYDPRAASLLLRDILEAKGYPLRYVETHEGHSYGNVRGLLDELLTDFFAAE